jgi:CspA family cold shock protein
MLHMPHGTIKKLVKDRGFGFISMGQGQGDVFFHVSSVDEGVFDALQEGQPVEYEIVEDGGRGKGPRAGNVRPA